MSENRPAADRQLSSRVHEVLSLSGEPLSQTHRDFFEPRFGADFSGVRVHADAKARESARELDAVAYTVGNHIVVDDEHWHSGSRTSLRLLAHELTHTRQQQNGRLNAAVPISIGPATDPFERQAEQAANDVCGGLKRSPAIATGSVPFGVAQRQLRSNRNAGGCGICEAPNVAGTRVHALLTTLFHRTHPETIPEAPVPNPADEENGRLDLMRIQWEPPNRQPNIIEIGEIKPDNDRGRAAGRRDLLWYKTAVERLFPRNMFAVGFLDLPAPPVSIAYTEPTARAGCVQSVSLRNTRIGGQEGLYLYSCDPPGSTMRQRCCAREEPEPIPVPVPLTEGEAERRETRPTEERRDPEPVPIGPHAPPVLARDSDKSSFFELIKRLVRTGEAVEAVAREYFAAHPEMLDFAIGAAVAAIVATIIEDFATAGVGIADDPLIIGICTEVISVARAIKAAMLVPATL